MLDNMSSPIVKSMAPVPNPLHFDTLLEVGKVIAFTFASTLCFFLSSFLSLENEKFKIGIAICKVHFQSVQT